MFAAPDWFCFTALFVFGLLFGSFANVVIWRFPRGESLSSPPSHCPACDHSIRWRDNIPVLSWLLLRGRCRDCGTPIPVRYPLVELASAFLWVTAGLAFSPGPATLTAIFLFYLLLILSAIDLDFMRLPNGLVALLGGVGYLLVLLAQTVLPRLAPLTPVESGPFAQPVVAALIGSVSAGGLSLLIALLYRRVRGRSGLGMGDVKLLMALGAFLGVYTVLVLFIGSVFGAAIGIAIALRSPKGGMASKIPFGPFLALGAIVTALAGAPLVGWYLGLVTGT
jgi:leader peptidase (prepilin peptidase)/N-methyltransferase